MARKDPLRNFRFRLEIDGIAQAGFSEVSIAESTTDVIDYREGADPPHVRKLSGLTRYGNIRLRWGMTSVMELFQWHRSVSSGGLANNRKTVAIVVLDEAGVDAARFVIREAWPIKYVADALNAKGTDVAIETLELAHEGMERVQ